MATGSLKKAGSISRSKLRRATSISPVSMSTPTMPSGVVASPATLQRSTFDGEVVDDRVVGQGDIAHIAVVEHDDSLPTCIGHHGHDPAVVEEAVASETEDPLRGADLGIHRGDRLTVAVEVPPPGAIRCPVEHARGTPLRLEDRLVGATRDVARLAEGAVHGQVGAPQIGAVPRHAGMVPREPSQRPAVGARRGEA